MHLTLLLVVRGDLRPRAAARRAISDAGCLSPVARGLHADGGPSRALDDPVIALFMFAIWMSGVAAGITLLTAIAGKPAAAIHGAIAVGWLVVAGVCACYDTSGEKATESASPDA